MKEKIGNILDFITDEYLVFYIPTWIICVFMFFGIFVWPFVIGIVLLVAQIMQRRKEKKKALEAKNGYNYLEKEKEKLIKTIEDMSIEVNDYKLQILSSKELIEKFLITEEKISEKKKEFEELEKEFKKINENKENKIEEQMREKYEKISKELKKDHEKLIIYYKNEIEKIKNKYDIINRDLDGNYTKQRLYYKDKEKVLKKKYDVMTEELKENYDKLIVYYKDEIESIKDEMEKINSDCIIQYYSFSDYNYMTSEDCKNELSLLNQKEREMRRNQEDVCWKWNSNENKRAEQRTDRKILRTFNAECNNFTFNITAHNIDGERKRIEKSFETLNKLYEDSGISLTKDLLKLKLEKITMIYTYELKKQQEKEMQKAIKEQMIEEAKAERELQEKKKRVEKDLQQHLGEINRMMKYMQKAQIDAEKQLYMDKIKELEEKIKVLEADKETVLEREANAKAGFVYIISNIGSFGKNIYKIGMTRRLEPMDRIKELSSASVPFEFDVHAMIFSSDAPELETMLHKRFADNAVNKVNPRKEFYNVDIDEIEKVVKENYNDTVQFTKIPIATEYRQSLNLAEKE